MAAAYQGTARAEQTAVRAVRKVTSHAAPRAIVGA
jgi:hypothetical protein